MLNPYFTHRNMRGTLAQLFSWSFRNVQGCEWHVWGQWQTSLLHMLWGNNVGTAPALQKTISSPFYIMTSQGTDIKCKIRQAELLKTWKNHLKSRTKRLQKGICEFQWIFCFQVLTWHKGMQLSFPDRHCSSKPEGQSTASHIPFGKHVV